MAGQAGGKVMTLDPGWIALIGTVGGGVGLKFAEHFLNKGRERIDEASRIRVELRDQIDDQRKEIDKLSVEVDSWREKYYDLRDQHVKLQTEMMLTLQQLKENLKNDLNGNTH